MLQKIKIKLLDAVDAYKRLLSDYSTYSDPYLDKNTGCIFCLETFAQILEDQELTIPEIRWRINNIRNDHDRYLRIPSISHDSAHRILEAFISSNWIDNDHLKDVVSSCYDGSIGRWEDNLKQSIEVKNPIESC